MAQETNADKNFKLAMIIIIVLVVVLGLAFFALMQKQNQTGQASDNSVTSQTTSSTEPSVAGSLGKNEIKLTNDNFQTEVLNGKGVFLVDFFLSTCPHCQKVAKFVTAVSDELAGKAKVGKIESSENRTTSDKYEINGVPTFIVFKDGKEMERAEGERTKQELLDLVNKYLK